jgi:putative molybdopterin biosynthesis protein
VGSFGGILSLKKGETTISPIHILDEKTGTYNIEIIKKYFPNGEVQLIKGLKREQGLIIPKGNPKNIEKLSDLVDKNLVFINRQRGAGTRILLDYKLKKLGIDKDKIIGYDREATTHLSAAMAVKSGNADLTLGVRSAANILNLDFIPIGYEDYDFAILKSSLEDERVKRFIEYINSEEFKEEIDRLDGYKV